MGGQLPLQGFCGQHPDCLQHQDASQEHVAAGGRRPVRR